MRFRVYTAASYNFSDLAQIYIQQNRLSGSEVVSAAKPH
jgi:hypothetical protein